ncbi:MAG: DNA replication/repair protein RecF [Lachnospiraceae bacterium]
MRVKSISVNNFRNLSPAKITPDGGLNLILGDNAQGKTNLLESVCLCCLGKSPRTDKEREMINYDADFARVNIEFTSRYGSADIAVVLSKKRKKAVAVNSVPILKIGELLGYLNAVYFSPDEIRVIRMSPADRRRFLDVDLCQADRNYYYSLVKYNKILNQRNNLIKKSRDIETLKEMLFVWDAQLARECARIVAKRARFCDRLKALAADAHKRLTDGKESLEISYVTQIEGENVEERKKRGASLSGSVERILIWVHYVGLSARRPQILRQRRGYTQLRLSGTAAHGCAFSQACRAGNFQGAYRRLSRAAARRRVERAGFVKTKAAAGLLRQGSDYSHRDAYRRGADSREGICGVPLKKRRGRAHKIV